jgi:hypothetical protein
MFSRRAAPRLNAAPSGGRAPLEVGNRGGHIQAHLGEHTTWVLPSSFLDIRSVRGRCLPHKKQDMVVLLEKGGDAKGEPDTLDL